MTAVSANNINDTYVTESQSNGDFLGISVNESLENPITVKSPGSFNDLQNEIDNASDNSILFLDRDYTGIQNSNIILNKNLTIDGQGHKIDCLNKKNCFAFYSDNGSITLKNIIITNSRNFHTNISGAIYITKYAQYTIENCTFSNNMADNCGGAIYNNASNPLSIIGSKFIKNRIYEGNGGAVYSKSFVNLQNCIFSSNSACTGGGAIYSDDCINVTDCLFENNYCESIDSLGGAIKSNQTVSVNHSIFRNNHASKFGGAISARNVETKSSTFNSNNVINANGGAIHAVAEAYIENTTLNNNKALNNGGALYSQDEATVINSSFKSNSAELNGGAVYCDGTNLVICQSIFESNKAEGLFKNSCGGAVFAKNANITSSIFLNNYAKENGGAVYTKNLITSKSIFKNNKATKIGGAVAGINTSPKIINKFLTNIKINSKISIRNTTFIDNQAEIGGGICFNTSHIAEFLNCVFTNNSASSGGAAYGNTSYEVKFSQCLFTNNTAELGGGINKIGSMLLDNCTFLGNKAKNGGAVYINNDYLHTRLNSKYIDADYLNEEFLNVKDNARFLNCVFTGNNASLGGAVYNGLLYKVQFLECIFTGNNASLGGAIYNQELVKLTYDKYEKAYFDQHLTGKGNYVDLMRMDLLRIWSDLDEFMENNYKTEIKNTLLTNNTAFNGGAIYNMHQIEISYCALTDNYAENDGGAIFSKECIDSVVSSYFKNNVANKGNGGAINTESIDILKNTTFIKNTAHGDGGAIKTNAFNTFKNTTFINNSAGHYGGGIAIHEIRHDITDSKFIMNSAKLGGAIFISEVLKKNCEIKKCVFIHNTGEKTEYESTYGYYNLPDKNYGIFVYNIEQKNTNRKWYTLNSGPKTVSNHICITDNVFFYTSALSKGLVNWYGKKHAVEKFYTDKNSVSMNFAIENNTCPVNKPIKLTFYLKNADKESVYKEFDMNEAIFDINPNFTIIDKKIYNNSVVLELLPKSTGVFSINVTFYGCSLSQKLYIVPANCLNTIFNQVDMPFNNQKDLIWNLFPPKT